MTDRFTEASYELEEKNAYECKECDEFYGHGKKDLKNRDLGHDKDINRSDKGEIKDIKH